MGITGLLPLLKPITKDTHLRELKRMTVGIDTYCWLHKGIYCCSAELCQGIPTDKFIKYCVARVHLLLSYGIQPYLVFDGGFLPAKAGKEEERRKRRTANLERGKQLLREGNASGAHQFFSKAADVTPLMAHRLIKAVKRIRGVKYVVAPYEADAQLGFLARNGHVDAVITEDSDVLLFGCTRVLFKLDRDGMCQEVDLREVFHRRNDELDMRGMGEDELMMLCALSGCDYLPSVQGIGLKKAHRLVVRHKELQRIMRAIKLEVGRGFPVTYEADFQRALLTFRHQRAFDPVSRTVVHMTPLPDELPEALLKAAGGLQGGDFLEFLGPPLAQDVACAIADGDVDPITGKAFEGNTEESSTRVTYSTEASAAVLAAKWRGSRGGSAEASRLRSLKTRLSAQGNNLTKYWGVPQERSREEGRSREKDISKVDELQESVTPVDAKDGDDDRERAGAGMSDSHGQELHTPSKTKAESDPKGALSPSCTSPNGFYSGYSTSSNSNSPCIAETFPLKENVNPTSGDALAARDDDEAGALASSKHFSGPPAAVDHGQQLTGSKCTSVRLRHGRRPRSSVAHPGESDPKRAREDTLACRDGDGRGELPPWGLEFALPAPANTHTASVSVSAGGAQPDTGCGQRTTMKRRRTLGVGCLSRNELMSSLGQGKTEGHSGAIGQGRACGGLPRRSRSFEGLRRAPAGPDYVNDAKESDCCSSNLFERFEFAQRSAEAGPGADTSPQQSDRRLSLGHNTVFEGKGDKGSCFPGDIGNVSGATPGCEARVTGGDVMASNPACNLPTSNECGPVVRAQEASKIDRDEVTCRTGLGIPENGGNCSSSVEKALEVVGIDRRGWGCGIGRADGSRGRRLVESKSARTTSAPAKVDEDVFVRFVYNA